MAINCGTSAAGAKGYSSGNTGMGIGPIGGPNIIHKRKFRFVFSIAYCKNTQFVPAYFVKTAARPGITIEDTEVNFLNTKTWIPGKASWETIDITYYDVGTSDNIALFSWLATIYDFTNPICNYMSSMRQDYTGIGTLVLLDGCGNAMETWTMGDMWPTSIKFGDLDYSSSDLVTIDLTLRYSQVSYINNCGGTISPCGCTPCAGGVTGAGAAAAAGGLGAV